MSFLMNMLRALKMMLEFAGRGLAALFVCGAVFPAIAANTGGNAGSGASVAIEERLPEKAEPDPDLAYGAYQRGMYLTAFELALPRAQLGDAAAQTLIAELYDKGLGIARDQKEAADWYKIAANSGNIEAQFAYASKLLEGRVVKADQGEARRLMKLAADGGHPSASYNFGRMILDERPTSSGAKEAYSYFSRAADKGLADAYFALAQLYDSGALKGFPEQEKAFPWLLRAASAGVSTAQVELAIWVANGKGTKRDPVTAFQWMRRAALGGNVVGQSRLAKMYAEGLGTEVNLINSATWHIIARRAGLSDPWLDELMVTMNRDDFAKALSAANNWPAR